MFLSLGLAIISSTGWLGFLSVPLLALAIIAGHHWARSKTTIELEESGHLIINGERIPLENIEGYFLNDTGLTQSALSFRLFTAQSVHIVSLNKGDAGKKFELVQTELIAGMKRMSPNIKELKYQDIYIKQMAIMRPVLIVLAALVLVLDIVLIIGLILGKNGIPWQFFFVNFLLIWLWPFMKKKRD
jgi:hypothetical protein